MHTPTKARFQSWRYNLNKRSKKLIGRLSTPLQIVVYIVITNVLLFSATELFSLIITTGSQDSSQAGILMLLPLLPFIWLSWIVGVVCLLIGFIQALFSASRNKKSW